MNDTNTDPAAGHPGETLRVDLGERGYPIQAGRGGGAAAVAAEIGRLRDDGRRVAVISDERVWAAQHRFAERAFGASPRLLLPPGEPTKSLGPLGQCWDFLAAEGLDRQGVLFAFGGGVVGDLAGFAAASYLRGIDFVQVPTTLLAMVDSSVGGKTGINLKAGKNLVGAFHQPQAVFIDTDLLGTLPGREFAAGMAEVIKTGLLGDRALFEQVEGMPGLSADHPALPGIILRCCAIKAAVVEADEREQAATGGRALLNLGHTFAHAIEAVAGYGDYLHGEAVGIGLVLAVRLSENLGYIDSEEAGRVETTVAAHRLPVRLRKGLSVDALLEAMGRDKKVRSGKKRFVVLREIGRAVIEEAVDEALLRDLWTGGSTPEAAVKG